MTTKEKLEAKLKSQSDANYLLYCAGLDLQAKLEMAVKALEFYGNIACPLPSQIKDNEKIEFSEEMDHEYFRGGKAARQALKEIKE